jgi:hypothetical protein
MKNNFFYALIALIVLSSVFNSFSQDYKIDYNNKSRFSRPHDYLPENIYKPNFSNAAGYTDLPVPFVNYNISRDSAPQNEPSVKMNKKNPNFVVAAWRDFSTGVNPPVRRVGYSRSIDGGLTWAPMQLLPVVDPSHPRASDPAVCMDANGNFYIVTISIDVNNNNGEILIYKSTDGGVTFPIYSIASGGGGNFEDKEYIVCDLTKGSSPYKNTLYISWTRFGGNSGIKMIKSTNGGINWSTLSNVSDAANQGQGSDPAVGPNGEVYVVWVGGTFSDDIIYFDKSTDGGTSFNTDKIIAQGTTPNITISSSGVTFPSIAVDNSGGPRNGYIYVTWCDARNGDADVFLSRSTNGGDNWSSPVRINNDSIGNGKLQCWPWIAVNDSGYIAVLFYDSRNTPANDVIEAYLAVSRDGGLTFTNDLLSSEQSTTNSPNTDVRFGDYIGIDYQGSRIVPVWVDERTGSFNMEVYTAQITTIPVGIQPITGIIPSEFKVEQNYPNPFNPSTSIIYYLPEKQDVSISIYDILGRNIYSQFYLNQNSGKHEFKWDASQFSSGIYFYKLSAGRYSSTMKMTLLK